MHDSNHVKSQKVELEILQGQHFTSKSRGLMPRPPSCLEQETFPQLDISIGLIAGPKKAAYDFLKLISDASWDSEKDMK